MAKPGPKRTAKHGSHSRYRSGCKCRKCLDGHAAYIRDWYARNPEKKREQYLRRQAQLTPADHKRWNLARYGLTVETFEEMWDEQLGLCAICQNAMVRDVQRGARRVCVDHCHESSEIRGLLCSRCNRGIGIFEHDSRVLQRAIKYLTA